jgi:hypothetical protein
LSRNYLQEMDDAIGEAIDRQDGWAVPQVAGQLFETLNAEDPELLEGWLEEMALPMMTKAVGDATRRRRNTARAQLQRDKFTRAHEAGDAQAMGMWHAAFVVDSALTRRRACDMTAADHRFVAGRYEKAGVESLMLGAFHSAVAAKVGNGVTSDVLSAADYETLYRDIVEVSR